MYACTYFFILLHLVLAFLPACLPTWAYLPTDLPTILPSYPPTDLLADVPCTYIIIDMHPYVHTCTQAYMDACLYK